MSHPIDDLFGRATMEQIAAFLIDGSEWLKPDGRPLEVRLAAANRPMTDFMKSLPPAVYREAEDAFWHAVSLNAHVYMELGLKAGARLAAQLLVGAD